MLFEAHRVKNFCSSDWHREHQIVYQRPVEIVILLFTKGFSEPSSP